MRKINIKLKLHRRHFIIQMTKQTILKHHTWSIDFSFPPQDQIFFSPEGKVGGKEGKGWVGGEEDRTIHTELLD